MTLPELKSTTWTGQRWVALVVGLFLAQLGSVFWLSNRQMARPAPSSKTPLVRWIPEPLAERALMEVNAQTDPTLFALPTAHGFSASAWLTVEPFSYRLANPPTMPRWLPPPADELADDFSEYVQTNLVAEATLPDPLIPSPAEMHLPVPQLAASTVLRMEGPLASRPLLPNRALPQLSPPLLDKSIVRVRVDPAGRVISAVLLSSPGSGSAPADKEALRFAKSARFAPDPGAGLLPGTNGMILVCGDLVFQWARVHWDPTPINGE